MITSQLESILRKDPITRQKFCGVYAEDRLPETLEQYPCGFIANTDPKGQPGKHWVAFYFRSPQQGEISLTVMDTLHSFRVTILFYF